jgi:hypothetical protein
MVKLRIIKAAPFTCLSSHFELALDKRPARYITNHKRGNDLQSMNQEALEMTGQTETHLLADLYKIAMADVDENWKKWS